LNKNDEPIFEKQRFGKLPPLKMPNSIEPEIFLKTQTLICKTQNANLKDNLILETA
jgi:hypothetical protein